MPARILILNSDTTSRSVLRAKMLAAQFAVDSCADVCAAEAAIAQTRPDLILINLGDMDAYLHGYCKSLRNAPETASISIIATGSADTAKARFAALDAGADDVMPTPINDAFLLARMRSLLRVRSAREELVLRESMTRALGFDEPRSAFDPATNIAFIQDDLGPLTDSFVGSLPNAIKTISRAEALDMKGTAGALDVAMIDARDIAFNDRTLFGLVSDLRAREATRYTAQLVIVPPDTPEISALFLDLGADDVVPSGSGCAEIALRVKALIRRKQRQDALRDVLHDGVHAALTDPLTGLYNRRYCDPHLAKVAEQARSSGRAFAVLMIDIDHFKLINDSYGHAAGDLALIALSHRLRENLRAIDTIARVGGEEFMVVMPRTSVREARLAADRLRRIVNSRSFDIGDAHGPISMTISVGVAVSEKEALHDCSVTALCQTADQALYAAKSAGRNQIAMGQSAA